MLHFADGERLGQLWVDIVGQELNVFDPVDGSNKTYGFHDIVTSATPRQAGGVLLTLRRSVAFFDYATEELETIAEIEADMPGNRFNDGKTDRQGRHWAGTMGDVDWNHPIGNLYRIGADRKPVKMAGNMERIIELPVSRGTSVVFGGPNLDILYVTTMRTTLNDAQLAEEPLAGCLLAIDPGVRGIAEAPFAG